MARLIEENQASAEVLGVYADIKATRQTDWINNFWKALARHPSTLKRIWENIKHVMAPGALDPLTKELVYIAVSVTNNLQLLHRVSYGGGSRQGHERRTIGRTARRGRAGQRDQPVGGWL